MPKPYLSRYLCVAISSLLAVSCLAATPVYKKVMPDGSVIYSDEPVEGAQLISVEPVPTVPAIEVPPSQTNNNFSSDSSSITSTQQNYDYLTILSPSDNAAFHSGSGTVEINIENEPELLRGHRYKFYLGNQLIGEQRSRQLILNNVDRGTYNLSVHIVNRAGKVLQSANSSFTVHRTSRLN